MSKMKKSKKKMFIVTAFSMAVISVSAVFFKIYYSRRIKSLIENDKLETIKEYFEVKLPENGELLMFDNTLNVNECSGILKAAFKINNSDKDLLKQQLDELYDNSDFTINEFDLYKNTDCFNNVNSADEVDFSYQLNEKSKKTVKNDEKTYKCIKNVLFLKSEKGSFDVYFFMSFRQN